ncbi:MAG: tetratricopeptide repeat protein [Candidatus Koribacter versatilis]|uniref:Tetratricopeptide repeat protein n=1 Tax=Candidatus Korobacter versatilis TaxID=658062 RepID=A0A932A7N5_9BACT|nr:tetratricopeptide repeat protein [Candidatus Koribacter versatilis]
MKNASKLALALAVLALLATGVGCNKLKARDQLNKGVQSYKSARYEQAIEHFKQAVELDPKLINARLYLATAYANQVIPNVDSPENVQTAQQAIDEFQKVLDLNPTPEARINSMKGIASLYFNTLRLDQAREWHQKVLQADPSDAEAEYSIAVIDWTKAYKPRMEERAKLGLKPTEPLKDKKVCQMLRDKNQAAVQEGIDALQKAIQLRPDYDDAMAYLNLMYRERADIQCDDPAAQQADLQTADEWVKKTMDTKRAKAEKAAQASGGIVMDDTKK